jgi:hypothetical protein
MEPAEEFCAACSEAMCAACREGLDLSTILMVSTLFLLLLMLMYGLLRANKDKAERAFAGVTAILKTSDTMDEARKRADFFLLSLFAIGTLNENLFKATHIFAEITEILKTSDTPDYARTKIELLAKEEGVVLPKKNKKNKSKED